MPAKGATPLHYDCMMMADEVDELIPNARVKAQEEKGYDIIDTLAAVGAKHNATVAQVALAWLLYQPSVSSVIIGARNATQLKDNLASVDLKLDADDLKQIDEVSKLAPEYPGWMFNTQGSDRRPGQVRDWSRFIAAAK